MITHGTDTMEETAYFLDLTVKCNKPVVLVGAMRPSTSMSADGPFNLYNAVVTAADKQSANRGVLVVMNDTVMDGRDVTKTNTTDVATFKAVNYGPLGYIHNGKIDYQRTPERKHTTSTPFDVSKLTALPKVGIVYNYANASDLPAKALVDAGYDGIVSAGVGNGNLYKTVFDTLATAAHNGTVVVRSSRVPTGATTQDAEVDDAKYGFVASGTLNPQKARVLLQLALTQTKDQNRSRRCSISIKDNAPVGRPGLSLEDLSHNQHYYLANYHPGYDNRGCHVSGREVHKWFDNGLLAQRCLP